MSGVRRDHHRLFRGRAPNAHAQPRRGAPGDVRLVRHLPGPDGGDDRVSRRAHRHGFLRAVRRSRVDVTRKEGGPKMIAYKFLRAGRIGPFSRFAWPEPGVWVRASASDRCRRGIHACRMRDLPWWLGQELWEIELDG